MAANPETPFSLLLRADSEHPLPDDDKEVTAALASYGANFQKGKKFAPDRLNLLAGLMWVHAHQDDLHLAWPAASVAQHRILATALRLDYDELSKTAPWLTMIVRRVLANIAPGSAPAKRKAASLTAEGQIWVPGGGDAGVPSQSGPPAPKKKKASKGKKAAAKESSSSSSSDGSDSSSDSASESTVVVDAEAPLASMPDVLGSGAAFAALVAARCNRSWVPLSVIENAVPVAYRCHVIRSKM